MSVKYCTWDNRQDYYLEFAVSLPICITWLLLLFVHTLRKEFNNKHPKRNDTRQIIFRSTFIIIQACSLSSLINELFRQIIDPFTFISRSKTTCNITSKFPTCITAIYYSCFIIHILLRLDLSFKSSFVALRRSTLIILLFIDISVGIIVPILVLLFSPSSCINHWLPLDINVSTKTEFSYCAFRFSGIGNITVLIGIAIEVILNVVVGVMFSIKLKKLLLIKKSRESESESSNKYKSLATKNTILTMIGSISTLLSYVFFVLFSESARFGSSLLYLDVSVNNLMIALMFNYNKEWYNKMCKCCVDKINTMVETTKIELTLSQSMQTSNANNVNIDNIANVETM